MQELLTRFKATEATEFRTFLLYLGPALLLNILDKAVYEHFLLFHAGITILCSDAHIATIRCEAADILLKIFVEYSEQLYNLEFLVYNVHCLIHLAQDAKVFGKLYNFSAFPFENYLKRLIFTQKMAIQGQ